MTLFKNYKSSLRSVLSFFAISASLTFVSCQDEDFGFSQSDIYQKFIERRYAEEFAKVFPNVDPEHTWMCTPDTAYIEVAPGLTRAAGSSPSIEKSSNTSSMGYSSVTQVLNYMMEGDDNYNNHKAATDFEYKAVENTNGDGYEVYTITPTFWGRKFVDRNAVGVYYMNGDQRVDMDPFWDDNTKCNIEVFYKDGTPGPVPVSDQQITDHPQWANAVKNTSTEPNVEYLRLWKPCDECGVQFVVGETDKDGNNLKYSGYRQTNSLNIVNKNNWNSIQIFDANGGSGNNDTKGNAWDTQFFVTTPNKEWKNGETFEFHMRYIISSHQNINVGVQYHSTPGSYVENGGNVTLNQGDGWQEITFSGTIKGDGVKTIAFNLNVDYQTLYNFRDITWVSTSKKCNHTGCESGRVYVDHYQLPQYTLKMPVGTVWGMYLKTDKQQTSNSEKVTWYSNSAYNLNNETSGSGKVKSAATFTYGDVTYISFEDAPTVCSYNAGPPNNPNGTGTCDICHRGHWDHDYNDIVLTISPRPVTKTYRAISYRVMCEDLGGTFDWDFNDVVFDVLYKDGSASTNYKATIEYKLQAIGGTLPIYMKYGNAIINYNSKEELHEMIGLPVNNDGLYTPVNVACNLYRTERRDPIVIRTETLNNEKYSDGQLDIREYAGLITIVATQKNGNTSEVKFPKFKGDATPQCFMTNTGTPWADELQPITVKYPKFKSWVESFSIRPDWWKEDM